MNAKQHRTFCTNFSSLDELVRVHLAWARSARETASRLRAKGATYPLYSVRRDHYGDQAHELKREAVQHYRTAWCVAKIRRRKVRLS